MNKGTIRNTKFGQDNNIEISVNLDVNTEMCGKKYNIWIVDNNENNNDKVYSCKAITADRFFEFNKNLYDNVKLAIQLNKKCEFEFDYEKETIKSIIVLM